MGAMAPSVTVTWVTELHRRLQKHTLGKNILVCTLPGGEQGFFPHEGGKGCCVLHDEAVSLKNLFSVGK